MLMQYGLNIFGLNHRIFIIGTSLLFYTITSRFKKATQSTCLVKAVEINLLYKFLQYRPYVGEGLS